MSSALSLPKSWTLRPEFLWQKGKKWMNRAGSMTRHWWLLGLVGKNQTAPAEPVRQSKRNGAVQLQQRKTEMVSSRFNSRKMPVSPSFPCGYYGSGMNTARWWDMYFNGKVREHTDKLPPISATAVEFIMYLPLTAACHGNGWIQRFIHK